MKFGVRGVGQSPKVSLSLDKVVLQGAAEAAVLHCDHLVALYEGRLVDQALVNVEGGQVVDDDGASEFLRSIHSRDSGTGRE